MPEGPPFHRALVIKLRHHGDVLLTSPVFTTLAAGGVEADALVYGDTADMLRFNPAVTQIHCIGREWRTLPLLEKWQRYRGLQKTLTARGYDLIVHLTDHWHGATLSRVLNPSCSVAPMARRSSRLANRLWSRAFTHRFPVVPGNRRHTVEMHLDALRRIGIQPAPDQRALVFVPGAEALDWAERTLADHSIAPGGYIHVHPTSRWQFKTWSPQGMATLIDMLCARGERVVVTSAPSDAELAWIDAMRGRLRSPVVDLCGRVTLKQLGALIAQARAFVGVDSVPMHLAAALGTPTIALFGPSGAIEWGPWRVRHRIVSTPFPCRPCGFDGCGGGKVSECLVSIEPAAVLASLDDLLREVRR